MDSINLFDLARPLLSRLLGVAVASLSTWLLVHYKIELSEQARTELIVLLIGQFQAVYVLVHRFLDKKINPTDAARVSTAKRKKRVEDQISNERKVIDEGQDDDAVTHELDIPQNHD